MPLVALENGIRLFGDLREMLPGFSLRMSGLALYWGVATADSPLGKGLIMAEKFHPQLRGSYTNALALAKGIVHEMIPDPLFGIEGRTSAYIVRQLMPSVPLTRVRQLKRWSWGKKAKILKYCADFLRKFHGWVLSWDRPSAYRLALQAIWPGNIILSDAKDSEASMSFLDFSGWGSIFSVAAEDAIAFFPPEARVTPERLTAKSDVFCLGSLAYFMVMGMPPPADLSDLPFSRAAGKRARMMIRSFLEPVPAFRPSIDEAFAEICASM